MPQFQFGNWKLGVGGGITLGIPGVARARVGISQNGNLTFNGSVNAMGVLMADVNATAKQAAVSGTVAAKVSQLNATAISDGFSAVPTADQVQTAVWFADNPIHDDTMRWAMQRIFEMYELLQDGVLFRRQEAPHFYIGGMDRPLAETRFGTIDLSLASPSANLLGETDIDMLVRVYPAQPWVANFRNSGRPGANCTLPFVGSFLAYYAPMESLTLEQIFHLWDYTPDSGPPIRNGITDFANILAMLPVQY